MLIEQVTIADNARRTAPTGFAITSTGNWQDADQAYFDNYFAWEPQRGGGFQVVLRAGAITLAHRGTLKERLDYREYRVAGARDSLREALIAELVKAFGAERLPTKADGTAQQIRINGQLFNLSQSEDGEVVMWMENHENTLPMVKLARHLDAVLATRRLDAHFKPAAAAP